jgi:pimeloyl-ACP methyl ester carboxylesterase
MTDTRPDPVLQIFAALTRPRRRPGSAEDMLALSGAIRHTIEHGSTSLAAWSWGEGPPVLLLHGWESRASHMAGFVPELIRAGLRAIALDAPAHGESDGDTTDVMDYGRAVTSAAAHFGPLAAVIAHSVGSAAALYAYAHGVRVGASVQLCGPASLTRVLRRGGAAGGLDAAGIARLEVLMAEHLGSPLGEMELSSLYAGMVHPALILHDPEDRELCVSESHTLAAAWPGSTLSLVPGLGHRRILRDPSVISSAVGFITNELAKEERCRPILRCAS